MSEQESLTKNGHFLWHTTDPARLSNLARAFRPALCNVQKSIAFAGTLYYNRLVAQTHKSAINLSRSVVTYV